MRAKYLLRIFPLMLFVFGVFKAYSATAIIYVDPVANTALPGEYFTINLNVANVTGLWGWECRMSFSPECLYTNSTMIEEGPFLKNVGSTTFSTYIGPQYIQAGCNFTGPDTVAGNGTLANITFYVVKKGASNFHLYESYLRDVDLNLIGHTTKDAGFSCVDDVAITSVIAYPTEARVGEAVLVNVTVKNIGNLTETFDVTTFYDNVTIGTQTVSNLTSSTSATLTFEWNTTGVAAGVYVISANTSVIPDEINITDNTKIDGTVRVEKAPLASFTVTPASPLVGEATTFDASSSTPNGGFIVSYTWDFGDGNATSSTNSTIIHCYAEDGNYTVALTVVDNEGLNGTTFDIITVLNRIPVALFTESATTVSTGEVIYFNASMSIDPDGTIISYLWNFGDGTNASGMTVDHAYTENGNYTVTLTVTDNDGAMAVCNATKNILNRSPVLAFTESAVTVFTGEVIHFNASASYDPDGTIVSYFWDFGDGNTGTDVTIDHSYADNGIYTVMLTAVDNDNAIVFTTSNKTVLNRPPIPSFTESATTVLTGEVIRLNASATYDPDGVILSYFWDFGDRTNASGIMADHAYLNSGTYTIILTVMDDDEAVAIASSNKTVLNRPPTALFVASAEIIHIGDVLAFNASDSYDPDGTIANYEWDFGDGNVTTLTFPDVTHVYASVGNYTVTLKVSDNEGLWDAESKPITVRKLPVAAFTYSPTTPVVGKTVAFNAGASTPDGGTITRYTWDFGDGTGVGPTSMGATHTYTKAGSYTVTLTITDSEGLTDTETKILEVKEAPADIVPYVAAVLMLMVPIAVMVYVKTKKKHPK